MKKKIYEKDKGFFSRLKHQILLIDIYRYFIASLRYIYFVKVKRNLKTFDLEKMEISAKTISHNLKGLKDLAVVRSNALIKPLSVNERLNSNSKILSIGPRTEGELFNLVGNGFKKENIVGLDLISYSPWVKLGDMHQLEFDDNSFDAVILGWVIAYSNDPFKAASEVVRVTKNRGLIAVGVEMGYRNKEEVKETLGYLPGAEKRITSTIQIEEFFGKQIENIYYRHDSEPAPNRKKGDICLIFSVKK